MSYKSGVLALFHNDVPNLSEPFQLPDFLLGQVARRRVVVALVSPISAFDSP